jgi:hypothetical protein
MCKMIYVVDALEEEEEEVAKVMTKRQRCSRVWFSSWAIATGEGKHNLLKVKIVNLSFTSTSG